MSISKREKKGIFIIFVDLHNNMQLTDNTKVYNVSDIDLIETANILRETFRESDIIGRIERDEFAVIPIDAHRDSPGIMDERLLDFTVGIIKQKCRHRPPTLTW